MGFLWLGLFSALEKSGNGQTRHPPTYGFTIFLTGVGGLEGLARKFLLPPSNWSIASFPPLNFLFFFDFSQDDIPYQGRPVSCPVTPR